MLELAAIEIGHGREADVGMRAHIDPLAGDHFGRPGLVEQDERPDHLALRRRQRPAHLEIAEIARARHDQRRDRVGGDRVGKAGFEQGVPTHRGSLPACGMMGQAKRRARRPAPLSNPRRRGRASAPALANTPLPAYPAAAALTILAASTMLTSAGRDLLPFAGLQAAVRIDPELAVGKPLPRRV